MGKVALLERRQVLAKNRCGCVDLRYMIRRRELNRDLARQMGHHRASRSLEQRALIREVLSPIHHRTKLTAQFAVSVVGRLVQRASSQGVDRDMQQLRRGVDV